MTVRLKARIAIGANAAIPGIPVIRTVKLKTYPDVPLHPLDGPIPTD